MDLEIKASFIGQPHDFPKNKPNVLDEQGIDEGINNFRVSVSWMLIEYNLILHKEMRNIIIEVNFL